MAGFKQYIINSGDTLENIAEQYFGSSSQWPTLVSVNRLRSPFISDDPQDMLGPQKSSTLLTSAIEIGDTIIPFPYDDIRAGIIPSNILKEGSVLFIRKRFSNGDFFHDTLKIHKYHAFEGLAQDGSVATKGSIEIDSTFVPSPDSSVTNAKLLSRKIYHSEAWSEYGANSLPYSQGDVLMDSSSQFWVCVLEGTPGRWLPSTKERFGIVSSTRTRNTESASKFYTRYAWRGMNNGLTFSSPLSEKYVETILSGILSNIIVDGLDWICTLTIESSSGIIPFLTKIRATNGTGTLGNGTASVTAANDSGTGRAQVLLRIARQPSIAAIAPSAGTLTSIIITPPRYVEDYFLLRSNEFLKFTAPAVWPEGAKSLLLYFGISPTRAYLQPDPDAPGTALELTKPSQIFEEQSTISGISINASFLDSSSETGDLPTKHSAYSGISNSYPQGTVISFHDNPDTLTTQVLSSGSTLLIPDPTGSSNPAIGSKYDPDINDTYGKDIALSTTGQISFIGNDSSDILSVIGRANVAQAIRNRLMTSYGQLSTQPTYGNKGYVFLGSKYSPNILSTMRTMIVQTLLQDPRVVNISSINVSYVQSSAALLVNNVTIELAENGSSVTLAPIQINI